MRVAWGLRLSLTGWSDAHKKCGNTLTFSSSKTQMTDAVNPSNCMARVLISFLYVTNSGSPSAMSTESFASFQTSRSSIASLR